YVVVLTPIYFDVGNNNYINTSTLDQPNFWPYAWKISPTGRFSDGPDYAKVPIPAAIMQPRNEEEHYINGANFASAAAGSLVQTFQAVIDLKTQLNNYKFWVRNKFGYTKSDKILTSAVYLISIGTND
ncbi:hypothetical protein H5410_019211, partial [Solanum commersonii]